MNCNNSCHTFVYIYVHLKLHCASWDPFFNRALFGLPSHSLIPPFILKPTYSCLVSILIWSSVSRSRCSRFTLFWNIHKGSPILVKSLHFSFPLFHFIIMRIFHILILPLYSLNTPLLSCPPCLIDNQLYRPCWSLEVNNNMETLSHHCFPHHPALLPHQIPYQSRQIQLLILFCHHWPTLIHHIHQTLFFKKFSLHYGQTGKSG